MFHGGWRAGAVARVLVFLFVLSLAATTSAVPVKVGLLPSPDAANPSGSCGCPRIASVTVWRPTEEGPAFTLYGDARDGWGFTNASITNPGPGLVVFLGDRVSLTLIGNDPLPHNWFVDYNNNSQPDEGEPSSPDFQGIGATIVWNFTADRPGTYMYRCRIHPTSMTGVITIAGTGPPPQPPMGPLGLIPGIMIGTIVVVLLLAAIYQIRAVRARRPKG